MGHRQNASRDALATAAASANISQVLHKESILNMSADMTSAHTANPQDATWTAGIRTAMSTSASTLAALYGAILAAE